VGYLRVAARWPVQVVNPLCKRYAGTPLLGDLRVAGSFSVLFFKGLFIFSLTVLYAVARTGTVPTWKAVLPGSDGKACTPSYSVTGVGVIPPAWAFTTGGAVLSGTVTAESPTPVSYVGGRSPLLTDSRLIGVGTG